MAERFGGRRPQLQSQAIAQHGSFGVFPSSLMGVLYYVKQVISDTRHYADSKALYAASPAGRGETWRRRAALEDR